MAFSILQALNQRTAKKASVLLFFGMLFVLGLTACRSDRISVDPRDPHSPQYAYRKDELALLQMAADDIQELERNKRYGVIYDDYASEEFKKGVGRRQFMIMTNCVESFLGDLEEYDRNEIGFRREFLKDKSGKPDSQRFLDVLNRKVQRGLGSMEEQLVFVPNGLSFQLNGLYWIAKDKSFLQCMAQSRDLDAATAPKPESPVDSTEQPNNPSPPASDGSQATASPPPTSSGQTNDPVIREAKTDLPQINSTGPVPAGNSNSDTAPSVQPMKPAEIKKAPLKARPAGAGAVIDQRPVVPKTAAEKKAEEDAQKRRLELQEETDNQVTVPLPISPGSDD